jgi:HK97 family phage portal protein
MSFISKIFGTKSIKTSGDTMKEVFDTAFRSENSITAEDMLRSFAGLALMKRAEGLASQELQVVNLQDEPVQDTWLNKLLEYPNNDYSISQILEFISLNLDLYGNAYLYIEDGRRTEKIILVNSFGVTNSFGFYNMNIEGISKRVPAENVIHFKNIGDKVNYDSNGYLTGTNIYKRLLVDLVSADVEFSKHLKRKFERDGVDPFALTSEKQLTGEQFTTFRDRWRAIMPRAYWFSALLDDGKKLQSMSSATAKENLNEVSINIAKRIGAAFGVPMSLLYAEQQNKATAEVEREEFFRKTIEPQLMKIIGMFNVWLRSIGEGNLRLTYVSPKFEKAVLTLNEHRRNEELEELEFGNEILLIPEGFRLQNVSKGLQEPTYNNDMNIETEKSADPITDYWNKWDKFNDTWAKRLNKVIDKEFKRIENETINKL